MQLTDQDFARLRDYMYGNYGINLAQKRTLIEGRLLNVVKQKGYNSFSDYIDNLIADQTGGEVSLIVSKLTTNFTYFMREQEHFDFMCNVVLPEALPTIRDNNFAVWSAGCSSGEEPYSIAMVLDDYFKGNKNKLDTRVLATDISDRVMNDAKVGVYMDERVNKLSEEWKKRYFTVQDGRYAIANKIKNEVIFRKFNLMEKVFNFKRKFHLIFCRNVMIYFDNETRRQLTSRFYSALAPGGYLFIGMSESLVNMNNEFKYVKPSIYKKER
ncbi:MAG TPA: chemotaxis protein CheR [Clostridiales bacterium]|nr:chemotaxis protein CheR [Clostridiales bacterium]